MTPATQKNYSLYVFTILLDGLLYDYAPLYKEKDLEPTLFLVF